MSELLLTQPVADDNTYANKVATLVIAAEGDLRLAAEMLGKGDGDLTKGSAEVLGALLASPEALIGKLNVALLLSMLQMLTELKAHMSEQMDDFSPRETIEGLRLVTEGIKSFAPPAVQTSGGPVVNNLIQLLQGVPA